MFDCQATYADDRGSLVSETTRPKLTRKQRLTDRRSKERAQYEERKLAQQCTKCGVASPDAALCPECLATERARTKSAIKQLRATRRARRQCVRCGRASERYECLDCLRRVGRAPIATVTPTVTPAMPISHGALHAGRRPPLTRRVFEAGGDGYNPGTRNRYVGRGRKGMPTRRETDELDIRVMRSEMDRGADALLHWHGEEIQNLPRIQRDAALRDALSHLELMGRQLDELVERATRRLR